MTWYCHACGTTMTWALPIDGNPGMRKCPRCDRWMDLASDPVEPQATP